MESPSLKPMETFDGTAEGTEMTYPGDSRVNYRNKGFPIK